jgi:plasmid stabilization system protein ParE
MNVRFLTIAQKEVDDAVRWYDAQREQLGIEFLDQLDAAIRRITAFPGACPEIEEGLRRCILHRFPYGLIYGIDGNAIIIVAVPHLHREPHYWTDRIIS